MKTYIQMFKYNFKLIPKITLSLLVMMVSVTIYRLFFLGDDIGLFSMSEITIAQIMFMVVFAILLIGIYWRTLVIISGPSVSFLQMIPEIRKKAIIFAGLNLSLVFIWAVFILGYNDLYVLFSFTLSNLWFISTIITMSSIKIPVYRSNKYWFLKLTFALFSFVVLILSFKDTFMLTISNISAISVFLIVVLYQMYNFVRNYINYRVKEDFAQKGFGQRMNSLQSMFDGACVKELHSLIKEINAKPKKNNYIKLFQLSLFGSTPLIIYLVYCTIIISAFFLLQEKLGFNDFGLLILLSLMIASYNFSKTFRRRDKIESLYIISNLSRSKFEQTILSASYRQYLLGLLGNLPIFFAGLFIFSRYYNITELLKISFVLLISTIAVLPIIYVMWRVILKNKDYDTIKQTRVMSN